MKVLVAAPDAERVTTKKNDFNYATPGEVLTLGSVCDGDAAHRRSCGCGRAFSGLDTTKATTFGIVKEMDADDVRRLVRDSQFVTGWTIGDDRDETTEMVMGDVRTIAEMIEDQPVGSEIRVSQTPTRVTLSGTTAENEKLAADVHAWRTEAWAILKAEWKNCSDRDEANVRIKGTSAAKMIALFLAGTTPEDLAHYFLTGEKRFTEKIAANVAAGRPIIERTA